MAVRGFMPALACPYTPNTHPYRVPPGNVEKCMVDELQFPARYFNGSRTANVNRDFYVMASTNYVVLYNPTHDIKFEIIIKNAIIDLLKSLPTQTPIIIHGQESSFIRIIHNVVNEYLHVRIDVSFATESCYYIQARPRDTTNLMSLKPTALQTMLLPVLSQSQPLPAATMPQLSQQPSVAEQPSVESAVTELSVEPSVTESAENCSDKSQNRYAVPLLARAKYATVAGFDKSAYTKPIKKLSTAPDHNTINDVANSKFVNKLLKSIKCNCGKDAICVQHIHLTNDHNYLCGGCLSQTPYNKLSQKFKCCKDHVKNTSLHIECVDCATILRLVVRLRKYHCDVARYAA